VESFFCHAFCAPFPYFYYSKIWTQNKKIRTSLRIHLRKDTGAGYNKITPQSADLALKLIQVLCGGPRKYKF